jgi:cell wall-associated NlpC family hydrolase
MSRNLLRTLGACALAAFAAGCASSGAVPKPFPMPSSAGRVDSAPEAPAPASTTAQTALDSYALVGTALDLRGVRYRNGGSDPSGFDCSGFTQYVYAKHGVALPRAVREQFGVGKPVWDGVEAGDLLFFSTAEPGASHVAIAVGGDEFVHAPSSTGVVRVEHLSASYWSQRFIGARRVTRP